MPITHAFVVDRPRLEVFQESCCHCTSGSSPLRSHS